MAAAAARCAGGRARTASSYVITTMVAVTATIMMVMLPNIISVYGDTRVYYIAAEEVEWNYLPTGYDCVHGALLTTNDSIPSSLSCPALTNATSDDGGDGGSDGGHHMTSMGTEHQGSHDDGHDHHAIFSTTPHNDGTHFVTAGDSSEPSPEHSPSKWVLHGAKRIGRQYIKARYQEYTDATFSQRKNRTMHEMHLGLLGPIIRGVVGDSIHIVFMNRASLPFSIHVHGLMYAKPHEGAPYDDEMNMGGGDSVAPGANYTYKFTVPERSGPGPNDGSSVVWLYHSHVDEVADTNAGLFGAIIITRAGWAKADGSPIDVDREFVTSFTVYDETESGYFMTNARRYLNNSYNVDYSNGWVSSLLDDSEFLDSNEKHAMNGYLYGNVPGFMMEVDDRVRWYSFTLGSEEGLHTPHWHGQTLTSYGLRVDSVQVLPSTTNIADMVPDNEGLWMYHCHVNHHIHAGMTALFGVSASTKPVPHTQHNEPVAGWIWFMIFLILAIPMSIFGGLFAKTYLKQSPPQHTPLISTPPPPRRSASVSLRARQATANGNSSNGSTVVAAVTAAAADNDDHKDNRAPVVVSRAKITAYSPRSPTHEVKITEKRGSGLAAAVTSLPTPTAMPATTSPLPSPPYQLANDSPLPVPSSTRPSSGSISGTAPPAVLTVHAEPLPLALAAPTTSSHQMVVAVDVFDQHA